MKLAVQAYKWRMHSPLFSSFILSGITCQ